MSLKPTCLLLDQRNINTIKDSFSLIQLSVYISKHHLFRDEVGFSQVGEMPLSDFTKSLVISLGKRRVPERANLHCLRPKAEFANSSYRALDWSEISFIKRKGISPDSIYHGKKGFLYIWEIASIIDFTYFVFHR